MKTRNTFRKVWPAVPALLLAVGVNVGAVPSRGVQPNMQGQSTPAPGLAPQPVTVDRITHNVGNIVTTVDNYGYIGGWSYYKLPSGEYPRNSGHDYIGEMKYWMGTITPGDDTLVANTTNDFQAMPMPVNGTDRYKIYLSTDTSRYYLYDAGDTVGQGYENPALGWRVWNSPQEQYAYNQNYDPLASDFEPGGPTSLQESHYRFNDAAGGSSLLGLELTQTMLQWNYCYNEDFIVVKLDITNTSDVNYTNFVFGLYADLDVGGPDGTGENGRLGDLVGYDESENLAWMYDADGYDPGWGPTVTTGFMGTKMLQTPQDIGVTAIRSGEWEELGDASAQRKYELLNSTGFDTQIVPRDLLYLQCTRGINFAAHSTIQVVYAIVAGDDEADLQANAAMAQQLYDNHYIGPMPPPTPTLKLRPSDRKVYVSWDEVAEVGTDPMSGENDFAGYKLYRSENHGETWGKVNYKTNNNCLTVDYSTVALYRVEAPGDPIPHSFTDTGLSNGVEYWYCLAAFDLGDSTAGVDPLQTGFGIAGEALNVQATTPRNNPAGFVDAAATVRQTYSGTLQPSQGQVIPIIFDQSALQGAEYQVTFVDGATWPMWNLVNVTTGDTVLADQTQLTGEPNLYDVVDGLRVVVYDGEHEPNSWGQTALGGADTTLVMDEFSGPAIAYWTGNERYAFGNAQYRPPYEIRFSTDSTQAVSMWEGFDVASYPLTPVPFEVWNTHTNQRVSLAMDKWPIDGVWEPGDALIIVNYSYDPGNDLTALAFPRLFGWRFSFDADAFAPVAGDVFTIESAPLNSPEDVFSFKIDAVSAAAAKDRLRDIRVVPDPYYAQYSSKVETSEGESVIEFQKIPDKCTIRIYTLSGELVKTITHADGSGAARWNLQSADNIQIASGIYLYHVESPYGEHLGRFAVIK